MFETQIYTLTCLDDRAQQSFNLVQNPYTDNERLKAIFRFIF